MARARTPPRPVTFRNTRTEANEFVFLVASRGAASIKALHDKLYTRSLTHHLRRDLPYEPHITIARYPEFPKLEAAADEALERFREELSDTIREVTLLSVGHNGKITRLTTFALNSA